MKTQSTTTTTPSRCGCGAEKNEQASLCTVCKALRDQAKRKAKMKAKMKRKIENPEAVAEWVEKVKTAMEVEMSGCPTNLRVDVTRKLIGVLCAELPTQSVNVVIPKVNGKDGKDIVTYVVHK